MLVNISKACQLAGISRTVFYENYINKGKVSVSRDGRNRPMVDTSEIIRVFGELKNVSGLQSEIQQPVVSHTSEDRLKNSTSTNTDLLVQLAQSNAENLHLKERLSEKNDQILKLEKREEWQREQIEKLTDTIKLLEAPKPHNQASGVRYWWQFWKLR